MKTQGELIDITKNLCRKGLTNKIKRKLFQLDCVSVTSLPEHLYARFESFLDNIQTDKADLIKKAYDLFPKGTRYRNKSGEWTAMGYYVIDSDGDISDVDGRSYVYRDDEFAKILTDFIIVSEDGLDLYKGDIFYHVTKQQSGKWHFNNCVRDSKFEAFKEHLVVRKPSENKAFVSLSAAEDFLAKNTITEKKIKYKTVDVTVSKDGFRAKSKVTDGNIWFDGVDLEKIWRLYQHLRREHFDKK